MFMIEVTCLSWFFCALPPPLPQRWPTLAQCERVLLAYAAAWQPPFGSYSFRCRKETP